MYSIHRAVLLSSGEQCIFSLDDITADHSLVTAYLSPTDPTWPPTA